jgi:hypothetical protein
MAWLGRHYLQSQPVTEPVAEIEKRTANLAVAEAQRTAIPHGDPPTAM